MDEILGFFSNSGAFSCKTSLNNSCSDIVVLTDSIIYNRAELCSKYKIENCCSDASMLAELYNLKGESFVSELRGDFSIVLYDRNKEEGFLFRDRLGTRPLLYSQVGDKIYFASEAKCLSTYKEIALKPNLKRIIADLFFWFWADKSETYFENVFNVMPGEYIKIRTGSIERIKYWDIVHNKYIKLKVNEVQNELVKVMRMVCNDSQHKIATLIRRSRQQLSNQPCFKEFR